MKLLWLCNMVPGAVKKAITGKEGNGLWVDNMLCDLRARTDTTIRVLCPYQQETSGSLDHGCSYHTFRTRLPHQYLPALEEAFCQELETYQPEVIHCWGTEYAHTLAMVKAAERTGYARRLVVSIQGLCSVYAGHYAEGVPVAVQYGFTLRDLLRMDNIHFQRKAFEKRGDLELQALKKTCHVIGRTQWDKACTSQIQPAARYHFCNETLRSPFYQDRWQYERCVRHRIFASSCVYPVKGFHYLLEAMAQVAMDFPDVTLTVPGKNYMRVSPLRRNSYQKYLAELTWRYGLEEKIEFLGSLDAEGMKQAYLNANVFVLPSTIENSPNSLGEAMVLGLPAVAADVGGVTDMMTHNEEGFVYQSTAPYMLAHHIKTVFEMGQEAEAMGQAARAHALKTHAPEDNFGTLLGIYEEIAR